MDQTTTPIRGQQTSDSSGSVSVDFRQYDFRPLPAIDELQFSRIMGFLFVHAPLMLIFRAVPIIATIHSVAVFLIGLHFLVRDKQPRRVAWVIGYLAGAEILWRGVDAALISEYAKYATIGLCILMLLKYYLLGRATRWPMLLFALLVPAIIIAPTFNRQAISYQLAGQAALGIVSMVFSTLEFKKTDIQRLFLAVIAPTIAMAFFVAFLAVTGDATFSGGGANEEITGGIGANQVTSALSLGATTAFFYIFLGGRDGRIRNLMIGLVISFLILSVLTFSRAGLWNWAGAMAVGILFLMRDRRQALNILGIVLVFSLLGFFVIVPLLNDLTGGALLVRYSDFDSTGRDLLVQIDYQVFVDNPVWGVGVGQSPYYHLPIFGYLKPTHTEYSRLLAEHGSLGIAVMVLLALVTLSRMFSRRSPISKAISLGFTTWALLYLAHSATRMVAPSFAFGLAAARFLPDEINEEPEAAVRMAPHSRHF